MTDRQPGERFGAYGIEHVIGRGGGATVYRVRHDALGTVHAMKVPRRSTRRLRDRLLQEGRVQAQLAHGNVVSVRDIVHDGDDVALVMDLVEGVPLGRLLEAGPLTEAQVDALARQLFDAVEAAHALGVVHRDLKLDNVLADVDGDQVRLRVTDFGLVKAMSEGLKVARTTMQGAMMGTPAFMAPEQFRDASTVDARADLYSLGCILYALASGTTPFPLDSDVRDQLVRTLRGSWEPLDRAAPHAPARWVLAVHACLELKPEARPASVAALRALWAAPDPGPVRWPAGLLRALGRGRVPTLSERETVLQPMGGPTHLLPPEGTISHGNGAVRPAPSGAPAASMLVAAGGLVGLGLAGGGAALGLMVWIASLMSSG